MKKNEALTWLFGGIVLNIFCFFGGLVLFVPLCFLPFTIWVPIYGAYKYMEED